jgi:hypothetical protein
MATSCILLLAAVLAARADEFWKHKPASDWTFEEALQILKDSPWAKREVVVALPKPCDLQDVDRYGNCRNRPDPFSRNPRRGSGITLPQRNFSIFLVRWDSAPQVAAAFARLDELGEHATAVF